MYDLVNATRKYREILLSDPYRPVYHFAQPDGKGIPGDSNGCFYADGVYHIMYLYQSFTTQGNHWGHLTSTDLVHWYNRPDALIPLEDDYGCYSGGAFVDDDKTAYLSFWKFPSRNEDGDNGGIAIAYSRPPYDKWERLQPIAIEGSRNPWGTIDLQINGKTEHIGCADPSNIWKANGYYYLQTGNKCVLDAYGRDENSDPHYQGDWTDLFRSKDLKTWEHVHRFYINDRENPDWPDKTEDDMCPSFLPLFDTKENGKPTGKWLQLFISHNRGCQYYIGTLEDETFVPETHGRMSWNDNAYFAPEALIDDKNRHIIWTWLQDNIQDDFKTYGWSSVYAFPRTVWLENDRLCMAPAAELDLLQYNHHIPQIYSDNSFNLKNSKLFRLKAEIKAGTQDKTGFSIRISNDKKYHTDIYYDNENKLLVFDSTNSGIYGWKIKEEAPFMLSEDENLKLDIFADNSVIEVYANERQAICRRIYHANADDCIGFKLIGDKNSLTKIQAWEMSPANPY